MFLDSRPWAEVLVEESLYRVNIQETFGGLSKAKEEGKGE